MTPPASPILTASEMRAAEAASGLSVDALMDRAGAAVAHAAWRFAGSAPVLVIAGPGNNGGDGYVAARYLRTAGLSVRVARSAPPTSEAASRAAALWDGPVESLADAAPAPTLIDALFGAGLTRRLADDVAIPLTRLSRAARHRIAVDVPSGVDADSGAWLGPVVTADLTLALGALKPAHLLQPAAASCGRLVIADIGIATQGAATHRIAPPARHEPGPTAHKYSRGLVAVVAGAMPGAAALASASALRGGAGYVLCLTPDQTDDAAPHAVVRRQACGRDLADALADARIGAVLIGPGLGRDVDARARLDAALGSGHPLVLDGDALALLGVQRIPRLDGAILTPHDGEFARLFGRLPGSKLDRARAAARSSGAVVLLKGADSVVASPDGRAAIAPPAPGWLASAGTGDVLAGLVAARRAGGEPPFAAACAAASLHAEAARIAGPNLIADDLVDALRSLA